MRADLRKYPYPYRAVLAICSDLDETPNEEIYFETLRYLNSRGETLFGQGLGLEVGNTIYFHMPEGQFSYWNSSDKGREKIRSLIRSGHVDCLHSFGDFADSREKIAACWQELKENDCHIKVWVDHAQAPSNLDPDIMFGKGALAGSSAYHTDLTFSDQGIEYVWKGRVTSLVAQNVSRSYAGIFNFSHPVASLKTLFKEFVKGFLGRGSGNKYAMHSANQVLRQTELADGTPVKEFMRTNPSWEGVSSHEKGREIGEVLTARVLDQLVRVEGASILYTHLGKIQSLHEPFGEAALNGFRLLSERYNDGEILLLTTRRLLDYLSTRDALRYTVENGQGRVKIMLRSDLVTQGQLAGMTWYVDDPGQVDIYLNQEKIEDVVANPADFTGRRSVSIPLHRIELPDI